MSDFTRCRVAAMTIGAECVAPMTIGDRAFVAVGTGRSVHLGTGPRDGQLRDTLVAEPS